MKKTNKLLVSIIVVNYNNAFYLKKCLDSLINQSYKSTEIIVVDDQSVDHSLDVLKKFKKKVKYFKTLKKKNVGCYDQMNAYLTGFKKSKGEIIFFIDSDDYFKKDKVKIIVNNFLQKNNRRLIFDLPILQYRNIKKKLKFNQRIFFYTSWPRFTPQSCMALRKDFAKEVFKTLLVNKFETIWFDFRIANYHFLKYGNLNIIDKYLTYYRQIDGSASKNYKFLTKNWWFRRKQAHDFISFLKKKLKLRDTFNLDKFITFIFNKIR